MKRKSLLVLSAIAISLLAASCGGTNAGKQTSKSDLSSYPLKSDTELTYWSAITSNVSASASNLGDTEFAKELEKRTGVKIKYIHPALGQEDEQFSLMIASNELPDMIQRDWLNALGGPASSINDNVIISLNDYLPDYAPNLSKFLKENSQYDKMIKTDDGDYYVMPFIKADEALLSTSGMIIRNDWLNELGLDEPKTADDWEKVLTEFKDKKNAVAPLTIQGAEYEVLLRLLNSHIEFYIKDGKVVYGPMEPEFKEAVTKLRDWYQKGLIDKNFASVDSTVVSANILNGKSGVTYGSGGSGLGKWLQSSKANGTNIDLKPIKMYAADGTSPSHFMYASRPYSAWGSVAITSACKDVPLAVKFLDYNYSEDGYMLNNFGIEGVSYNMVDGYPTYTDQITNNPDGLSMSQAMSMYLRSCDSGPFIQAKEYIEQFYSLPQQQEALVNWKFGAEETLSTLIPQVTFTADESSEYSSIYTELKKVTDNMTTAFITGVEPIENFDSFQEQLKKLNVDKAIKIQQTAVDRYNNRK